jgi:hypothetical protein
VIAQTVMFLGVGQGAVDQRCVAPHLIRQALLWVSKAEYTEGRIMLPSVCFPAPVGAEALKSRVF